MVKGRSQTKDSEQAIRSSPLFNFAVDSDRGPIAAEGQIVRKLEPAESEVLLVRVRLDNCIAQWNCGSGGKKPVLRALRDP